MMDATATEPASKQRLRLWLRMLRATRRIENALRDRLREEFETTLPRFDVLAALDRNADGLKMTELSKELMVSNGNVTGIVERLVADGLITRLAIQGDRRSTLVQLTDRGRAEFQTMASAHEGWIDELLGAVAEQDLDDGIRLMSPLGQHRKDEQ